MRTFSETIRKSRRPGTIRCSLRRLFTTDSTTNRGGSNSSASLSLRSRALSAPPCGRLTWGILAWGLLTAAPPARADAPAGGGDVDYRQQIEPLIKQKCLRCHGPQQQDGMLDLSSRTTMLKGGNSGPALVPGDPETSLMLELIEFDEMPPRKEKPRVTGEELKKLTAWIAAGAPVPDGQQRAQREAPPRE